MLQNGPRGNPAPPPRPSGISALSHLVSHAVAPVEHVAQVVQHSAPAQHYIAAHSAPAPRPTAPSPRLAAAVATSHATSPARSAPITRLAAALAALTPAERAQMRIWDDPFQTVMRAMRGSDFSNPWLSMFNETFVPYSKAGGRAWPSDKPDTLPTHPMLQLPLAQIGKGPSGRIAEQAIHGFRRGRLTPPGLSDRFEFHPPAMRA